LLIGSCENDKQKLKRIELIVGYKSFDYSFEQSELLKIRLKYSL
jgi:hypothetical protein